MTDRTPSSEAALRRRLDKARNTPPRQTVPLAERIAKCHADVRTHIRDLEHRAKAAEEQAAALEKQLAANFGESDTMMGWAGDEDVPDRALMPGATITFGGRFEVCWRTPGSYLSADAVPSKLRTRPGLVLYSWADEMEVIPLDAARLLIREAAGGP